MEVKIRDKVFNIEILKKEKGNLEVMIDDRKYNLDILRVENDIYSILYKGKSYDLEVVSGNTMKNISVAYECMYFDVELLDAQSKYLQNRKKGNNSNGGNVIMSPMPGKVVKIPVSVGEEVKSGATIIIISAMKMESEYKAHKDGIISKIFVSEGDIIEGNKPLIAIE